MTRSDVLIVGSSVASARSIQALRRYGFPGSLTVITDEKIPFYNRPPLTKEYLTGSRGTREILLIDEKACSKLDVRTVTETKALRLDLDSNVVHTRSERYRYGSLILATGVRPRRLPSLSGQKNVFYVRDLMSAQRLRDALDGARSTAVVGLGFIGCEFASSARSLGIDVTVVDADLHPSSHLGRPFSHALASLHRENGVRLVLGATVDRVVEQQGTVTTLVLSNGAHVSADVFVVAVGVSPNTEWLVNSGLALDDGIVCEATLEAAPNVYAAGDVARWPHPLSGAMMRVEHWTNAVDHAATVAYNVLNPKSKRLHAAVPYFWSTQFASQIQCIGFLDIHAHSVWLQTGTGKILGLFGKHRRLTGAVGIDSANLIVKIRSLVADGTPWEIAIPQVIQIASGLGYVRVHDADRDGVTA